MHFERGLRTRGGNGLEGVKECVETSQEMQQPKKKSGVWFLVVEAQSNLDA